MNMRLVHPGTLIDINGIGELAYVHVEDGQLVLGAMARDALVELDTTIATRQPLLTEAVRYVGHPAIRNRSTVGGSIAYADPAAELPAVMLALNADFELRNRSGCRIVSARHFFKGYLTTDLKEDELLTALRIPDLPARSGCAFVEFSRRAGDFALVGVAAVIVLDEDGTIADARLGLCGAGPAPVRPQAAETLLQGQYPGDEVWMAAANAVVVALDNPFSDIHGSADYRRHLADLLVRQVLALAAERARRN
jgi:CO/xanthine dehydrogenase FAD-binding subunit